MLDDYTFLKWNLEIMIGESKSDNQIVRKLLKVIATPPVGIPAK